MGANMHVICQSVGLQPAELQGDKMYDLQKVHEVWQVCMQETKDERLGLHIGEKAHFESIGIVGFMMQNSADLQVALERGVYYQNMYSSLMHIFLKASPGRLSIVFEPAYLFKVNYPQSARQAVESSMAFVVTALRKLSGKNIRPLLTSFQWEAPAAGQLPVYECLFQTTIAFRQTENSLSFSHNDLQQPVLSYNRDLFALLNNEAERLLKTYHHALPLSDKVKHMLIKLLQYKYPGIAEVAAELGLSIRTLQRKLKEENTTFQQITDDLNKELALGYIQESRFTISDIAYLLGYAEPGVFTRAFKRWTGENPTEYREKNGSGASLGG
jgi:AraC-like DNA-binding protein